MCLILICSAHELPEYVQRKVEGISDVIRASYQPGIECMLLFVYSLVHTQY